MQVLKDNENKLFFGFLGPRVLKTVLAVFICFTLAYIRNSEPFYSVIATIICMKGNYVEGYKAAKSRMFSTLIGSLFGSFTIILAVYLNIELPNYWYYILLTLLLIPIIYICVHMGFPESSYLSCVIFLIITITRFHDKSPIFFVFKRTRETIIGILVSIVVNKYINLQKFLNNQ